MIIAVVAVIILILNFLCLRKPSTRILSGLAEHISEKKLAEIRPTDTNSGSKQEQNIGVQEPHGDKEQK